MVRHCIFNEKISVWEPICVELDGISRWSVRRTTLVCANFRKTNFQPCSVDCTQGSTCFGKFRILYWRCQLPLMHANRSLFHDSYSYQWMNALQLVSVRRTLAPSISRAQNWRPTLGPDPMEVNIHRIAVASLSFFYEFLFVFFRSLFCIKFDCRILSASYSSPLCLVHSLQCI